MPGAPRHGAACSINSSFLDARPTLAGGSPAEPHAPASWPTSDATGASPIQSRLFNSLGPKRTLVPPAGGSPIWSRSFKLLGPTGHLSHLPGAPRRQGRGLLRTPQVNLVILLKLPQNLVKGPTLARHRSTNSRPATLDTSCTNRFPETLQPLASIGAHTNMPTPPLAQTTNFT